MVFNKIFKLAAYGLLLAGGMNAHAITLFDEDFEGYTSFPSQIPKYDYVNAGIPKISEGASEVWYGARFEDGGGTIDSDFAIQKIGGGSNMSHTGRVEDDAGQLFRINTTGLTSVTLSFDWRTFQADSGDRIVVGYHVGSIGGFGPCTGNGEAGCFADLRADSATPLPWYTTDGGSTLTGNWNQLLSASASNSWIHQSYTLTLANNAPEVWVAFWMNGDEGNYFKFDNVLVTAAPIPEVETWAMMLAGVCLVGLRLRRKSRHTHVIKM